jgi:DNA ligase (NAD+)
MNLKNIIPKLNSVIGILYDENIDVALHILEEMDIESLYEYLTYCDLNDKDNKTILGLLIRILQNIYNNFAEPPPLTDEQYDILYEKNREFEEVVGSVINTGSDKTIRGHLYPDLRGTLDKAHFITREQRKKDIRKSLEDWRNDILEVSKGREDINIIMMPKFDGISVVFECEDNLANNALTRGFTENNEAVELTMLSKLRINFKENNDNNYKRFGVKTEIIMNESNYESFQEKYGSFNSQRSAISSIFNSTSGFDKSKLNYITIVPLQVQDFDTKEIIIPERLIKDYPVFSLELKDLKPDNVKIIEYMIENIRFHIQEHGSPLDGVVLRVMDKDIQTLLGRKNNINKYEVAYKFPPEQTKSIIQAISFDIGILGSVTPVAKIEPVKMKGNKVKSISLGSIKRFRTLKLRVGDEVIVKYDIVPYLDIDDTCKRNISRSIIEEITTCPYCNEKLIEDPILKCVNNKCKCRIRGKILNFINKMNIMNISKGIVNEFFEHGLLNSIEDIYRLKDHKHKIINLHGYGKKSFNKIIDGIEKRMEVFDYELLGSIGITDVGRKIFKKLLNIYYIDELIKISLRGEVKKLISINGIGDKMANKIIDGIIDNELLIKFLMETLTVNRDNKTYVMKVCFTKVRDKEFEKFLDNKGVLVIDNVTKDLDILITDNNKSESSKSTKAKDLGIMIQGIDEFKNNVGYKK